MRFSQFYQYFKDNFKGYGLMSVDALHVKGQDDKVHHARLTLSETGQVMESITEVSELTDGDFRGYYSKELVKESDVIVTNPPFSLVREFISFMEEEEKRFLIVASLNAISYKEVYPLITSGKVWTGVNSGTMYFVVPDGTEPKTGSYVQDGKLHQRLGNLIWLTNLKATNVPDKLKITKSYQDDPNQYPTYYNFDAIEVGKLSDIPYDYTGIMGVPITYITKHNPEQFEIVGHVREEKFDLTATPLHEYRNKQATGRKVATRGDLYRPLRENEKRPILTYKDDEGNEYRTVYSRYIIKRKG